MSVRQRIHNIIFGVLILLYCALMIFYPQTGYLLAAIILSVGLMFFGIRTLVYFFTMARYMVGGRVILYEGVIITDLAVLAISVTLAPSVYIIIYLLLTFGFAGVISILRAFEAKKGGASWKLKLSLGLVYLGLAICCVVFIGNVDAEVYIFCAGLIYLAAIRIIQSFRSTSIVYVQ